MKIRFQFLIILFASQFLNQIHGDLKSIDGTIKFDANNDQIPEMILQATGLTIGLGSSSANLAVMGNAIVTRNCSVGSDVMGSSNLQVSGTMALAPNLLSANTTLNSSSLYLVDTTASNIVVTLPSGNMAGREIMIKKINLSNNLTIYGGGNLIDNNYRITYYSGNLGSLRVISNGSRWFILNNSASLSAASVVVTDTFSGTGNLHDQTTTTGGLTWTATSGANTFFANGSFTNCNGATASLPFLITANKVYEISLDANPTAGISTAWVSIGFSKDPLVIFTDFYSWMLASIPPSSAPSNRIQSFTGLGASNGITYSEVSGIVNLKVKLDTRPLLWETTWYSNNVIIRGPVPFELSNPSLNYISIGSNSDVSGNIDNFSISTSNAY